MGFFDIFKSEERRKQEETISLISDAMKEMHSGGVASDEIPGGYGPFGLVKTNPVPTCGIKGSNAYLENLRTVNGRKVQAQRRGSVSVPDVTKAMIDMYDITCNDEILATIYICPYNKRNSSKSPDGFVLA